MKHLLKDEITCPYCNHVRVDSWEYELRADDTQIHFCERCNKRFEVTCSVSIEYSTVGSCEENGELPHRLIDKSWAWNDKTYVCFECEKCFEEFYGHDFPGQLYPKLKEGEYVIASPIIFESK